MVALPVIEGIVEEEAPPAKRSRRTSNDTRRHILACRAHTRRRSIFAIALTLAAYEIQPFGLTGPTTIALGLAAALGIIYFEYRLKTATLKRLIGAAIGDRKSVVWERVWIRV